MSSPARQATAGARTAAAKGVAWLGRLRTWQGRLEVWLGEAGLFWLASMVLALALAVAFGPPVVPWERERLVRLTGMLMQLAGIATVAAGVRDTRALFQRPSYWRLAVDWLKRAPRWGARHVAMTGTGRLAFTGMNANLIHRAARIAKTLKGQVAELHRDIDLLHDRITNIQSDHDKKMQAQTTALESERNARMAEDSALAQRIETAAAGGLHLSAMGLVWLFVGVVLASMSQEIAAWYR